MSIRQILEHGSGVVSLFWFVLLVALALLLDAPAFLFLVESRALASMLVATAMAIVASFASRWWLILVGLWAIPAYLAIKVLAHN